MAVKEIPTTYREYYKLMRESYEADYNRILNLIEECKTAIISLHDIIKNDQIIYKEEFGIDLVNINEFNDNIYINGQFLQIAEKAFINKDNNYELTKPLYTLLTLATKQRDLTILERKRDLYYKCKNLTLKQYKEILYTFYTEVHKHLILKGEGYVFSGSIGWICINRCLIEKQKPHINFSATRKRKAELIANGERIYNKDEAEWCKNNNIEYKAKDARVYLNNDHCYEIPLIHCMFPDGYKYKFETSDYRGRAVRGKSNTDIKEEYKDVNTICSLPLGIRTKLNICETIDKTLYLNFIRNEDQKPIAARKINR